MMPSTQRFWQIHRAPADESKVQLTVFSLRSYGVWGSNLSSPLESQLE
jgi:hypothetical protein